MSFNRQFRIYEERFNQPFLTGHGLWERRRSVILREEREGGGIAYGEIAPTPGFSENEIESYSDEARAWLAGEAIFESPLFLSALSCLSCGIWEKETNTEKKPVFSAVLNIDAKNDDPLSNTIKRKIGVRPVRQEIEEVLRWISDLPDSHRVRLDANESLDLESLRLWVDSLEGESKLEFIEQPLHRDRLDEIIDLSLETSVCFALDESVSSFGGPGALREMGWQGCCVIKPSLMKDWKDTIRFIRSEPEKSFVSTVFESPFGYEAVCRCAGLSRVVAGLDRSLFKGCAKEFSEHHEFPLIPYSVNSAQLEELWHSL